MLTYLAMCWVMANAQAYKRVPGIFRGSHTDRVANKIGFSKQDIDNYLADS